MLLNLAGKGALITGSSRGIGRIIAEVLQSEGCRVVLNARDTSDLAATASALAGAVTISGDVSRVEEAERVVAEATAALGRIDVLICNVGSGRSVLPGTETHDEWQRVFAVNLWSATNVIGAAQAGLSAGGGAIVCVSSICGLEVVPDAPVTYSAAKAALHAYVRGMARPFGKVGVRINAVAAGNMLFDGSVWSRKLENDPAGVQTLLNHEVALGKLGMPHDVADVVAYLASSRASFVTGAVWTVDGGQVRS